ncbi:unnamed protein product [Sphenostylis stenocarpa]|uniref:Uncharacterized protein n=1 Tax=Sphenostylis stenocarpa TaxID=92480 RepID=A0AA86W356_9FABA|nr:unnamed protein product [Sphenostylis stenocarpa]
MESLLHASANNGLQAQYAENIQWVVFGWKVEQEEQEEPLPCPSWEGLQSTSIMGRLISSLPPTSNMGNIFTTGWCEWHECK